MARVIYSSLLGAILGGVILSFVAGCAPSGDWKSSPPAPRRLVC